MNIKIIKTTMNNISDLDQNYMKNGGLDYWLLVVCHIPSAFDYR